VGRGAWLIYCQEFEEMIDLHGPDQVSHLMQKVISALEQLEVGK
jgi:hypothetical protein